MTFISWIVEPLGDSFSPADGPWTPDVLLYLATLCSALASVHVF